MLLCTWSTERADSGEGVWWCRQRRRWRVFNIFHSTQILDTHHVCVCRHTDTILIMGFRDIQENVVLSFASCAAEWCQCGVKSWLCVLLFVFTLKRPILSSPIKNVSHTHTYCIQMEIIPLVWPHWPISSDKPSCSKKSAWVPDWDFHPLVTLLSFSDHS